MGSFNKGLGSQKELYAAYVWATIGVAMVRQLGNEIYRSLVSLFSSFSKSGRRRNQGRENDLRKLHFLCKFIRILGAMSFTLFKVLQVCWETLGTHWWNVPPTCSILPHAMESSKYILANFLILRYQELVKELFCSWQATRAVRIKVAAGENNEN